MILASSTSQHGGLNFVSLNIRCVYSKREKIALEMLQASGLRVSRSVNWIWCSLSQIRFEWGEESVTVHSYSKVLKGFFFHINLLKHSAKYRHLLVRHLKLPSCLLTSVPVLFNAHSVQRQSPNAAVGRDPLQNGLRTVNRLQQNRRNNMRQKLLQR